MAFRDLFPRSRPIIGMVHLCPLPGSPRWDGDWMSVEVRARREAAILVEAGADALIVENFGDAPFHASQVDAATIASMAVLVRAVRDEIEGAAPVGVNVLRNDATAALSVAGAAGAEFIRVNVHTGAMVTDQGILQGDAANTLRERARLGSNVLIFADVCVKHGTPIGDVSIERLAAEARGRGLADALIVSGTATGAPTAVEDLRRVKRHLAESPLLAGSGTTPDTLSETLAVADGIIVGSALKKDGVASNPIDPDRVNVFFASRPV